MRYAEMKDSGVEWIGEIPKGWDTICFKRTHHGTNVGLSIDKDFWSTNDTDTVFYTAGLKSIFTSYSDFDMALLTRENDLLLARNGTPYVYFPKIGAIYTDHIIRVSIDRAYNKSFVKYCLQQSIANEVVDTVSIATWSVPIWNRQCLPLPPLVEQEAIAAHLDEKCGAIDEIIAEAKVTIEEYKAWKASVIFEAVTKGLDPNAEMKDSGVEWMGEIPKHWSCIPMKFMLNERNQKNDPVVTSERLSLSIDIGVTLYAEKTTNLDRFKEDVSQYKVAHAGDLVLNSMNMIVGAVGIAPVLGCVSPAYYVFYDNDNNYTVTRYCDYIFKNKRLRGCLFSLGQGIMAIDRGDGRINTCRLKVSRDDLGRIMLPCPPIEEQCRIISFLDKQCAAIDGIITEKQALIDDLGTYKKSLIYETVTGKRRVC